MPGTVAHTIVHGSAGTLVLTRTVCALVAMRSSAKGTRNGAATTQHALAREKSTAGAFGRVRRKDTIGLVPSALGEL